MKNLKQKLSNLPGKTSRELKPIIKKTIIAALTVAAFSFVTGEAANAENDESAMFYYVYSDNQFIGTVADKAEVEELLEYKLSEAKKEFKDLNVGLGHEISFVPEQVLSSSAGTDTTEVIEQLNSQLDVKAEASAVVIGGKPVAYLKDKDASKEVIRKLMLEFVTEDELNELEKTKQSPTLPLPALKENETRVLDVRLSEEVSYSDEKVDPKEVLTVEEAVELIKKGTLEEEKYKVKDGDVLGNIANSHDLKLKELLSLNKNLKEESVLKPGTLLNVTILKPIVEVVVEREAYIKEDVAFNKEVITDSSIPKGETKTKQEGKNGINGVVYLTTEKNGQVTKKEETKKETLQEPVKEIIVKGTKVIPSRGDGSFVWPASGGYVSSKMGYRWGKMHKGIDIARPSNYTIKAADNGVVVSASYDGGYGNKIVIDHKNGYRTVYAHLASMSVSAGQTVQAGSKIGVMGRTGDSTGVHLHFEVYKNGKMIDPLTVVKP